jgi:hypothetical protein
MENGLGSPKKTLSRAHAVCGDRLVETTPEVNREVAESAMLLSQGARRAIEMVREAANGNAERAAPTAPAGGETRLARPQQPRLSCGTSPGSLQPRSRR